jgi:hypothetical protein
MLLKNYNDGGSAASPSKGDTENWCALGSEGGGFLASGTRRLLFYPIS